jgi:N-acetylglutamate synthase-like GNAT family acetyltransferase
MGLQPVKDVTLIRHAYVVTAQRSRGLGGALLEHLLQRTRGPILVGTWAAAEWPIRFYQKHGFQLVTREEINRLENPRCHIAGRWREQGHFPLSLPDDGGSNGSHAPIA